jgi:hypothetical protein
MTTDKDFKRVVRARMQKTGESYTTARAAVSRKAPPARHASTTANGRTPPTRVAEAPASTTAPAPTDYAALAGMSDEALAAKTGCTWEKWVWALDHSRAHTWSHTEIARWVRETYKIPGWWAQTVTVGYERIRGLRDKGQRREGPQAGRYEASKSRTYPVPVETLYSVMHDSRKRARWMGVTGITVRTATANRSIRMRWTDGAPVQFWFTAKGPSKASVSVQHEGFSTRQDADAAKLAWSERLDALGAVLAGAAR